MKSLREKAMMAVLVMVLLYGAAVAVFFAYSKGAWKEAQRGYERAKEAYARECALIARRRQFAEDYESAKKQMPSFAVGKATDTVWMKIVDELAEKYHIVIGQHGYGREVEAGEVLELPIEVKSWEGCLESLVRFIYELETSTDGMFDVESLNFKPSSKKGYLRGSLTLTCAYMREEGK